VSLISKIQSDKTLSTLPAANSKHCAFGTHRNIKDKINNIHSRFLAVQLKQQAMRLVSNSNFENVTTLFIIRLLPLLLDIVRLVL